MIYSEEQLQTIEKCAAVYLKISDMAVLLDINEDELRSDIKLRGSAVSKAYNRGKASSKLKLAAQEMKLAQIGSPLAVENTRKNLLEMEDDE